MRVSPQTRPKLVVARSLICCSSINTLSNRTLVQIGRYSALSKVNFAPSTEPNTSHRAPNPISAPLWTQQVVELGHHPIPPAGMFYITIQVRISISWAEKPEQNLPPARAWHRARSLQILQHTFRMLRHFCSV